MCARRTSARRCTSRLVSPCDESEELDLLGLELGLLNLGRRSTVKTLFGRDACRPLFLATSLGIAMGGAHDDPLAVEREEEEGEDGQGKPELANERREGARVFKHRVSLIAPPEPDCTAR